MILVTIRNNWGEPEEPQRSMDNGDVKMNMVRQKDEREQERQSKRERESSGSWGGGQRSPNLVRRGVCL